MSDITGPVRLLAASPWEPSDDQRRQARILVGESSAGFHFAAQISARNDATVKDLNSGWSQPYETEADARVCAGTWMLSWQHRPFLMIELGDIAACSTSGAAILDANCHTSFNVDTSADFAEAKRQGHA